MSISIESEKAAALRQLLRLADQFLEICDMMGETLAAAHFAQGIEVLQQRLALESAKGAFNEGDAFVSDLDMGYPSVKRIG